MSSWWVSRIPEIGIGAGQCRRAVFIDRAGQRERFDLSEPHCSSILGARLFTVSGRLATSCPVSSSSQADIHIERVAGGASWVVVQILVNDRKRSTNDGYCLVITAVTVPVDIELVGIQDSRVGIGAGQSGGAILIDRVGDRDGIDLGSQIIDS